MPCEFKNILPLLLWTVAMSTCCPHTATATAWNCRPAARCRSPARRGCSVECCHQECTPCCAISSSRRLVLNWPVRNLAAMACCRTLLWPQWTPSSRISGWQTAGARHALRCGSFDRGSTNHGTSSVARSSSCALASTQRTSSRCVVCSSTCRMLSSRLCGTPLA